MGRIEGGGKHIALEARHFASDNLTFEALVSHGSTVFKNQPRTQRGYDEPLLVDVSNNLGGTDFSGGYGSNEDTKGYRTTAEIGATLQTERHIFKAGLAYDDLFLNSNYSWNRGIGSFVFKFSDDNYQSYWSSIIGKAHNRVPAIYIQDSWQLTYRLRLNPGVRWDGQFMYGDDGKLAQKITDQFQPRFGFTYQIGELGTQKVFGFCGRFYQQIPTKFIITHYRDHEEYLTYFDHNPIDDPSGGEVLDLSHPPKEEIPDLEGQYFDEIILGWEKVISNHHKFGVRGIYRNLGQAVDDFLDFSRGGWVIGNPGIGDMEAAPSFERKYTGLELTLENVGSRFFSYKTSYTLSRTSGNYPGFFEVDNGMGAMPNSTRTLDLVEQIPNSSGLLPNDRTHVFKLIGSYAFDSGFSIGSSFLFASGTPLTEYGATSIGPPFSSFLEKRGSTGRSTSIWDWNLRFSYALGQKEINAIQTRLILDIFHVASRRENVQFDLVHYFAQDEQGNQTGENPNYMTPIVYQPPMSARLGVEVDF